MRREEMRNLTRRFVLAGSVCLVMVAGPAAAGDKPTADLTVSAYSQYIWRGFEFSQDSIVIQPSMTVGYKGFAVNVWGNLDTDLYSEEPNTNNWTETDLTVSYDWTMGPVGLAAGYIYYGLDGAQDTQEFYMSAGADSFLSPTLTVYRDTDNLVGWYITLGVSHSIPVKENISLELGARIGYLAADEASSYGEVTSGAESVTEEYSGFHDGLLSASLSIPVNDYVTITPELYYSFPLSSDASDLIEVRSIDGDDDNFVYGGVSMSLAF